MNKKQIISKVEEILHKKYDAGGIDSELVEDCINNTLEAISYSPSCTELLFTTDEIVDKIHEQTVLDGETFRDYFNKK